MKKITFKAQPYKRKQSTWGRTKAILAVILITFALEVINWNFILVDTKLKMSGVNENLATKAIAGRQDMIKEKNQIEDANKQLMAELEATKAKHPNPTKGEIESYVKTIFGADSKTAIAVSHHECGPTNKSYPACQLKTTAENSIGLFQINLYNSKQWIHAARIPGETMAEKEKWLGNPFNNTLYAYWVFKTSGFQPWSSFTSKSYLADFN